MMTFPEGFLVRRPTMNDVSSVFALMLARNQADYGDVDMTEEHIRNFWQDAAFNMDTDAWIVTTQDGQVIGYASVWHMQHVQVYTSFTALSEYDHLPIKASLLELVERRAQEFVAEAPAEAHVTLATGIAEVNNADQQLLTRMGYHKARGQYRMEIEMREPPPPAIWPEGISMRSCSPEQDMRVIYDAEIEAFANPTPPTFEQWEHHSVRQEGFDPSLWFLAYEGETIAGMCLCNYWVGAGHISPLAVRLPWRGKGLGRALLRHSFAEFYRRGTRIVKLTVDTQNPWGAVHLYEYVGMHITQLYHQYAKDL